MEKITLKVFSALGLSTGYPQACAPVMNDLRATPAVICHSCLTGVPVWGSSLMFLTVHHVTP